MKKHAQRKAWLESRLHLHPHVPGIHEDVSDQGRDALTRLHGEMRLAGLLGSGHVDQQREVIRRLVSELRGISVGASW